MLFSKSFQFPQTTVPCVAAIILTLATGPTGFSQDFSYYDSFDDGQITGDQDGFSLWPCQGTRQSGQLNDDGDFEMIGNGWTLWCANKFNGERLESRDEWSVRMLITVDEPSGVGVGTLAYEHVAVINNGQTFSAGVSAGSENSRLEPMPYSALGETLYFQSDSFDGVVTGSIWKEGDLDSMVQFSHPYNPRKTLPSFGLTGGTSTFHDLWVSTQPIPFEPVRGDFSGNGLLDAADIDSLVSKFSSDDSDYDLTGDGVVSTEDHEFWITQVRNTWYGDSNLDGEFNTSDFVAVFQAGEYEDAIQGNSTWAEGDWDADGDFTSGDFVVAFRGGGFEMGTRQVAATVPEPQGFVLVMIAALTIVGTRSRYVAS